MGRTHEAHPSTFQPVVELVTSDTQVLAYYFPQFHRDDRNDRLHGPGWTEWDLLRAARPRFDGHRQPVVPAWGEFDESDPSWAARQVDLAADHGVTGFLFDWYWYDGRPFLQRALEDGFLRAANRDRLKFALMWANHDWLDLFPARPGVSQRTLMSGRANRASFDALVSYALERYLHEENYLRLDGAPYFSIYELGTFVAGLGGLDAASDALASFRERVRRAGFPDLHLNAVVWGVSVLPSEVKLDDPAAVVRALGFSSLTTYAWVHHYAPDEAGFPQGSYADAARRSYDAWTTFADAFGLPYHPNVSVGWDPSPRTAQDAPYENHGYPFTAVLDGNTPEAFADALRRARTFVEARDAPRIITVNAWNEWTEGSYLLPDVTSGDAYLRALRDVLSAPPVG